MFTKLSVRIIFLFVISLIVLVLPNLIRNSAFYIGEDSYFYQRISGSINKYDELSYSGRDFTYPMAQPLIFFTLHKFMPEYFIINIIPIILGIISLILFYLILKELYAEPNVIYLSLIILILSPSFIYIFSSYNYFTFITLILLSTFYLFIKKNDILNLISYILFFIIPFFGYEFSILALFLILIYCIKQKQIKKFYVILIISFISISFIYFPILSKYGLSQTAKFDRNLIYQSLISDLGGGFGISIFIIFLSFFGISYLWKYKYKYYYIYLSLILFILFIFYFPKFIVYLNFLLSFLSGFGLINLLRSKWESETIRKLTLWLLILGLIFSTITSITEISKQEPGKNLHDSLIFLKNYDKSNSVVFSHYSYGIFINSIADKKNVMDSKFLYSINLNERYQDSKTLFYTRSFETAQEIIKKYDIKYILITKKMKEGFVWEEKDEGLLFLLNSGNIYKNIYNNDEVEIWEVKK
jgi:hypothetical protein